MKLLNKKAAMFGLDARIALAIFGALSVISGAALYSAIQQAKAVQWQTYFNELNKASDAYYLDTGREIPLTSVSSLATSGLYLAIRDLVWNDDNIVGWGGPYLSTESYNTSASSDMYFKDNMTTNIGEDSMVRAFLRQHSVWDTSINTSPYSNELCVSNSLDCSEWFSVRGEVSPEKLLSIFNIVDDLVDNGDGQYSGVVRYSSAGNGLLFYKGRPRIYKG